MSPLTCDQVEEQIELYAVDECDAPARQAIEKHLAQCPSCRTSLQEAQQLVALLDLKLRQEDGIERLHGRIAAEVSPPRARRGGKRTWRPLWALAALVLATLGVSWWLGPVLQPEVDRPMGLALAIHRPAPGALPVEDLPAARVRPDWAPKSTDLDAEKFTYSLDLHGETTADFRHKLEIARAGDALPSPPVVDLTLEIRNRSERTMYVWLGGGYSVLSLDLRGPGAVTVPVPGAANPLGRGRLVTLAAGRSHSLTIPRLEYGPDKEVRCAYWTEPGAYTLTIKLRTLVCRGEKQTEHCTRQTITCPPLSIKVEASTHSRH